MPKAESPPITRAVPSGPAIKSKPIDLSDIKAAIAAAKQRFIERNPVSGKLFGEATTYLPGGNTRTLLYTAPYPICMKKGECYRVFDEDGHV
jgi:glutamate-1-semialdehyde 2,1-aminomutase